MMKNKISIFFMCVLTAFLISACNDDDSDFNGPYRLTIGGATSAAPETTEDYTIGDFSNPGDYSWSVEGPASIVGSTTGTSVSVNYTGVGDVTLTVTDGGDATGTIDVTVDEIEPGVTASYNGTGVLRNGISDTVFFEFDAPVEGMPTFAVNTDSSGFEKKIAFTSGNLGALKKLDEDSFYAIYTAGTGNGTPEALFQDITSTDIYGGVNIDSSFVQLYRVDNITPVANLSYSSTNVNDSTVVTVTATFTEEVMFQDPADSALLVSFAGAGVMPETDTLMATDDPLVYTYDYTVNGEGTGSINVSLSNIVDLAGNPLVVNNDGDVITVDNAMPALGPFITSAVDMGSGTVKISITSSENGTGWYMILADEADAPVEAEDFTGSPSLSLTAAVTTTKSIALSPGEYDVYFIASDVAWNYSSIMKQDLTVD